MYILEYPVQYFDGTVIDRNKTKPTFPYIHIEMVILFEYKLFHDFNGSVPTGKLCDFDSEFIQFDLI